MKTPPPPPYSRRFQAACINIAAFAVLVYGSSAVVDVIWLGKKTVHDRAQIAGLASTIIFVCSWLQAVYTHRSLGKLLRGLEVIDATDRPLATDKSVLRGLPTLLIGLGVLLVTSQILPPGPAQMRFAPILLVMILLVMGNAQSALLNPAQRSMLDRKLGCRVVSVRALPTAA